MELKQVTIESHFLLVQGMLIDLGKVWTGTLGEKFIELRFMGGGLCRFVCEDDEYELDGGGNFHPGPLEPRIFEALGAYIRAHLKPNEIE